MDAYLIVFFPLSLFLITWIKGYALLYNYCFSYIPFWIFTITQFKIISNFHYDFFGHIGYLKVYFFSFQIARIKKFSLSYWFVAKF